jgi:hypothetical protein
MMRHLPLIGLFFIVNIAFLVSCDQDPLGLAYKGLPGGYYLHRWEDGKTYYLEDKRKQGSSGGIIDGTVEEIGWNTRFILVKRQSLFKGDPDGWMLIDVINKEIRGPVGRDVVEIPEAKGIEIMLPDVAWSSL